VIDIFSVKDFIETQEGLLFAVVAESLEAGKVLCFLRYVLSNEGWKKVNTLAANHHLTTYHPHYLFYSSQRDTYLHAVAPHDVIKHYAPKTILQQLLNEPAPDEVIADLQQLCVLLAGEGRVMTKLGITGSLLPGVYNPSSDIDLVCYDRALFHQLRQRLQNQLQAGQCHSLQAEDWLASYQRRDCDLSLQDYIWHEQRKFNKGMINQRKFDLSLVIPAAENKLHRYHKLGALELQTVVSDDTFSFDYPAQFSLQHVEIDTLVSYTATYTGQAITGEHVLISGQVEADEAGRKRIVVGSSREAKGEYIKVIRV
jgi:predicted nucleotidyltransferase